MDGVWHVLGYMFDPKVVLSHVIGVGLLFNLRRKQFGVRELVVIAVFEELLSYVLWRSLPDSWGTILSLAIFLYFYERKAGPRVEILENAVLLTEHDISDELLLASPDLNFDITREKAGTHLISSQLRYVEFHRSIWGKQHTGKTPIQFEDISRFDSGWDINVAKSLRSVGILSSHCFHVSLGSENKFVTFIAKTQEVRDSWVKALHQVFGKRITDLQGEWLRRLYKSTGVEEKETVSLDDALNILTAAQRSTARPYVLELYKAFTKGGAKNTAADGLDKQQFPAFFDILAKPVEIQQIYQRLLNKTKGEATLSAALTKQFLREEQKERVTLETVKKWIRAYETLLPSYNFSSVGFTNMLLNETHCIFKREHRWVYQDMRQPLSHYFIATSHNTYLTKDQIKSKSSVDAYINAFKRGCKCVELDCWDGPNNEPIIYHGHTLTTKILFKDVVKAIADYSFIVSDYPVILSFENHCSVEQQKVMASHLVNILGEKLYTTPIPESEKVLPSPAQLRGYVIVKAKKLKAGVPDDAEEVDDEFDEDSISISEEIYANIDKNGNGVGHEDKEDDERSVTSRTSSFTSSTRSSKKHKDKVPKIAQELSDLVMYCQAVHFSSFELSKEKAKHYEMSSFGESKAMRFVKEESAAFLSYNKRQLSRIYPAGSRFDSSNYDPTPCWNAGCQLVALNYQTPDRAMQLNQGLFQDNGGCGYVLKPNFMRNEETSWSPRSSTSESGHKSFCITVMSGHQIPFNHEKSVKSERSLTVQIRVTGVDGDVQKEKSKTVKNNGYNPVWNEQMSFKVTVPDLAIVHFLVRESADTFLGQHALPFRSMQQGYRVVPLLSKASEPLPHGSLFVHVHMQE